MNIAEKIISMIIAQKTIQENGLNLTIGDKNRARICFKDRELSKSQGFDVLMLCEGVWYDLSKARKAVYKISKNKISMYFKFKNLPIIQHWDIELTHDNKINWHIEIQVKKAVRLDALKSFIFLSKDYKVWFDDKAEESNFPSFTQNYQVCYKTNQLNFIGIKSEDAMAPSLIFKTEEPDFNVILQNTDLNLSSRAIEFQIENAKEFYEPGTYPYLKATIQLYPDKSVLENMLKAIKEERQRLLLEKEEEDRKRQEEERKQLEFKKIYIPLKDNGKDTLLYRDNEIYAYGDCEELHDKISSLPGDFKKAISKIKISKKQGLGINIKIGISRYNFFKLNAIIQFYSKLLNNRIDLRSIQLNLLPSQNIFYYFREYVKELSVRLESSNIKLFLKDKDLLDLLWAISSQADQHNEKILLRLLGVISEYPLIGPQTIVLDTYHKCNTNCIHCWIHTPKRRLSRSAIDLKMDFSLFTSIIDDAAKLLCDEIIFQGDGEPILDTKFFKMVSYARDKGLKVIFFTNAISLNRQKIKKIIDLEVNEIFCSLPAGTDKIYALINPGHSKDIFHHIAANLKDLILMRTRLGKQKPLLQMTHVIHNLNYHELKEMAKLDAYIGADKTRFYLVRLDENIKFLKLESGHIEAIRESLKAIGPYLKSRNIELQDNIYFQIENYNSNTGHWSENTFLKSGCPVGWFFSLVLAKNKISMCCHLRIIDYLNGKTFRKVWNSENYNNHRIQAKYLYKNKGATFKNAIKLYDDFCKHCDTHQVIFMINEQMDKYNLRRFL